MGGDGRGGGKGRGGANHRAGRAGGEEEEEEEEEKEGESTAAGTPLLPAAGAPGARRTLRGSRRCPALPAGAGDAFVALI